eukprot:XP_001700023.1 predicted protein [Chlamydomonas reinhardtii]
MAAGESLRVSHVLYAGTVRRGILPCHATPQTVAQRSRGLACLDSHPPPKVVCHCEFLGDTSHTFCTLYAYR